MELEVKQKVNRDSVYLINLTGEEVLFLLGMSHH